MAIDTELILTRKELESKLPQKRSSEQQRKALLEALDHFHDAQHGNCFRPEPLKEALKAYGEVASTSDETALILEQMNQSLDVYEKIQKSFVLPEHMMAIHELTKRKQLAISIRDCGSATLELLRKGALPKPHSILEKTIKPSSLEQHADDAGDRILKDLEDLHVNTGVQLLGCVGHWEDAAEDKKRLVGIRFHVDRSDAAEGESDAVKNADTEKQRLEKLCITDPVTGDRYFPVDVRGYEQLEQSVAPLRLRENAEWLKHAYTGDYDLHDLLILSGAGPRHIAATGSETQNAVRDLNAAMPAERAGNKDASEIGPQSLFQHGPQVSYYAQMLNQRERPDERISEPSFPLAMCDRGRWFIVQNWPELQQSYAECGVRMKDTWLQDDLGNPVTPFKSLQSSPNASRRGSVASVGSGSGGSSPAPSPRVPTKTFGRRSSIQMTPLSPQRRSSTSSVSRRNSAAFESGLTDSPKGLSPGSSPRVPSAELPPRRGSIGADPSLDPLLANYTIGRKANPLPPPSQSSAPWLTTPLSPLHTVPQSPMTLSFSDSSSPPPPDTSSSTPGDIPKEPPRRRGR